MQFDVLVFIGRFQPLHLGHERVIRTALGLASKVVICFGSANSGPTLRNPFSVEQRQNMIRHAFPTDLSRIKMVSVRDHPYNDQNWIKEVQKVIELNTNSGNKIGLIGYSKDSSSYYLKLFPEWESVRVNEVFNSDTYEPIIIDSTKIRNKMFLGFNDGSELSKYTSNYIFQLSKEPFFQKLKEEYAFIQKYKEGWKNSPYQPIFVTVDAVVVQSGRVLLVKRKSMPGEGLIALPGGFINQEERLEDAVIRELREETKLKVPEPVLRGSIKTSRVFDNPHRSSRGRTITHAYLFSLTPQLELPKVKGSSDAKEAFWMPYGKLDSKEMFEDHYHIVETMINKLDE